MATEPFGLIIEYSGTSSMNITSSSNLNFSLQGASNPGPQPGPTSSIFAGGSGGGGAALGMTGATIYANVGSFSPSLVCGCTPLDSKEIYFFSVSGATSNEYSIIPSVGKVFKSSSGFLIALGSTEEFEKMSNEELERVIKKG